MRSKTFAKVGKGGALSEKAETRLARSGKNDFGLSEIYARHLVYDVAAECEVPVISQIKILRQHQQSGGEARETKIREFLERITPIIAEQRGINVRSRVKMGAVAREMGLSDDDVEQALKSLQKDASSPEESVERLKEREAACQNRLRRKLAKRSGTVLTFIKEREYIEMGYDRFGVSHAFVRETIRSLTSELGVVYISQKQAREHMARLVDEKIGDSQRIVPHERQLLHREGAQWGLAPDDVDAVIREKHIEIDYAARSKQTRNVAVLAVAAVLVVGAAGGLGAFALFYPFSRQTPDDTATARTAPAGDSEEPAAPSNPRKDENAPPDWWDGPLASYIVWAGSSSPNCAAILKDIGSSDADVRGKAYEELIRLAPDPLPERLGAADTQQIRRLTDVEPVLIGCYALDPSDEAAVRLRDALLKLVPPPHSELPENAIVFRRAFWAIDTAFKAIEHQKISEDRSTDLVQGISRAVDTTFDMSKKPEQLKRASLGALCSHLYRLLIMAAPTQPNLALGLHETLAAEALQSLEAAVREGLDTDLIVAALPTIGDAWHGWEALIERCLVSRDKLNVIKILEVYERLNNKTLQDYLSDVLLYRVGLRADDPSVEEVVEAVRKRLGVTVREGGSTAAGRWATFRDKAHEALGDLKATPNEPGALLTEVIRLQHASTLGCALAQQELGAPTFAEINERKPETLGAVRGDGDAGDRPIRPPRVDRDEEEKRTLTKALERQLNQAVAPLRNFRTSNTLRRVSTVQWLASWTTKIPDVDPHTGDDIAEYLLTAKMVPEHEQVLPHVKDLCRWRTVRLGLADRFQQSRLRPDLIDEILTLVLGREVSLDEDKTGHERVRRDLLLGVADELSDAARPVDASASLYDRAANLLHDYYTIQARLAGVLPAQYMTTETPSAVLELAINQYATELSGRVKRPADREYLDALPRQLAAAKYLGTDDVQYTLLLERICLRLLAAGVALDHLDRADDADQLVTQLGHRDAASTHILTQLRDGHETTLRMWLLRCEP